MAPTELTEHVRSHPEHAQQTPDAPLPGTYQGAYRERRRAAGHALHASLGIELDDHPWRAEQALRDYGFFGAPHLAVVSSDRAQGTYGVLDCGGYVANVMNAALDLGVSSIAQGAIGVHAGAVHQLLGRPEDRIVLGGIALGWPDVEHPVNSLRTARADLAEVVAEVQRP